MADSRSGKSLLAAVTALEKAKIGVRGEHYKKLPRGFETEDEFTARMLRYNSLWTGEDVAAPKVLGSKRFVSWAMTRWTRAAPLHRWLVDNLH